MFYEIESTDARSLVKLVQNENIKDHGQHHPQLGVEAGDRIFSLDRVQYQFPGSIGNLAVSHNILHASLQSLNHSSSLLLKIDLGQPDAVSGESVNYSTNMKIETRLLNN